MSGGREETVAATDARGILVVEDDDIVREMVVTVLREQGFEVLDACTVIRAEDIFDKEKARIGLLLTDMLLPGGNGRDLALRFRGEKPSIKVIYMSGYGSNSLLAEIAPEHGCLFIPKPFKLKELIASVRDLLA